MSVTEAEFDEVVKKVNSLPKEGPVQLSDSERLEFYKHFKQATIGPNTTSRPGMFDFVGRAKWTAWAELGDMKPEEARSKYVALFYEKQPKE